MRSRWRVSPRGSSPQAEQPHAGPHVSRGVSTVLRPNIPRCTVPAREVMISCRSNRPAKSEGRKGECLTNVLSSTAADRLSSSDLRNEPWTHEQPLASAIGQASDALGAFDRGELDLEELVLGRSRHAGARVNSREGLSLERCWTLASNHDDRATPDRQRSPPLLTMETRTGVAKIKPE